MSVFEERVEAAARAIYDEWRSPDYFTWEQAVEGRNTNPDSKFPHIVDRFRGQARAALEAADAVVTEEELEKVLSGAFQGWTDQDDPFGDQARAILALFRGGAK